MRRFLTFMLSLALVCGIVPVVESITGVPVISVTADAASVKSYSQSDLNKLISTHDKFVKKYGSGAYLHSVSSEKTQKAYVTEVQKSINFLAYYWHINDDTVIDGYYGNDCKKLVKKVQSKLCIKTDSYFGPGSYSATVKKLKQLLGNSSTAASSSSSTVNPVTPAKDIMITQTPGHCTASAAGIMLRNFCRINGALDWTTITERTIRTGQASPSDTWCYGLLTDLRFNRPGCSYDGVRMKQYRLTGSAAQKKAKIMSVLNSHKEGVVLYGTVGGNHAVYMAKNGKILDPWYSDAKYRDLSQSANSCSDSWSDITHYWIIL